MGVAAKTATQPMTVSALAALLKGHIERQFTSVWVAGEVSNLTRASSGHWYFTLKDANAQIKAAMFRAWNLRIRFDPRDGMQVIARGRATVYEPRGEMQFVVEEMQPKGIGAAELALRQLKERLFQKGYFDPRRKKPLTRYPRRVGLIASASGAAIRDLIELFAQRWPLTELVVRPSRVQGDGAAAEVAAAIRMLNAVHASRELPLDAIVIGRGGGSTEDLWAFNEEIVAKAIFESIVPVVSAVGHEIDVTVADLVADCRAETPSAAVVALTPDRREQMQDLVNRHRNLRDALEQRLRMARKQLDNIATRPALRRPLQRIQDLEQRLDETAERIDRAANQRLIQAGEKMAAIAARLESLSPLNVLTRGYSLTQTEEGTLVRSATEVKTGDVLVTRVATGSIRSRVEATGPTPAPPTGAAG